VLLTKTPRSTLKFPRWRTLAGSGDRCPAIDT